MERLSAKEKVGIDGKYLGRRKITFERGPLTVVGEAYQDAEFITVVTNKGKVRISIKSIVFDDYAEEL